MAPRNTLLLAAAAIVGIAPLFYSFANNAEFTGSDNQAEAAITEIRPDYRPWFSSVWEPPSGEIESLLFSLQAALGAGFLGYYFGLRRGEAKRTRGEPERSTPRSRAAG
ncbi:MAG: energy-coupling factor ABC transporter substrate-binding protein [Rhodospirillales bacterium]|nr:energy-coupling factor ABC transporter substrate-binding protein [Rhodospirillales bacterium]